MVKHRIIAYNNTIYCLHRIYYLCIVYQLFVFLSSIIFLMTIETVISSLRKILVRLGFYLILSRPVGRSPLTLFFAK